MSIPLQSVRGASDARQYDGSSAGPMIGRHPAVVALLDSIRRAAPLDAPVLIHGATGVGKELVAERLHTLSGRRGGLVSINVAGLPEALVESELFGAVRGAYTGAASDRRGLVETSAGGTLYLDEAADLSLAVQAKLLRVLETGQVRPVGAAFDRHVRFRLVVSLQQDARTLVASGRWREDFFYRVAGICLHVPRLAERSSDIPALVRHFLAQIGRPAVDESDCAPLLRHHWPGNVRELRRVVERAAFLAGDEGIGAEHLHRALGVLVEAQARPAGVPADVAFAPADGAPRTLREMERAHIEATLAEVAGNTKAAARLLGLSLSQLYRRFAAHEIVPPRQR
jgi:DNA-binding NtrC family response regulator